MSTERESEMVNYRRRELLCEHEQLRLKALAMFPLQVSQMCVDLKKAIEAVRSGRPDSELREFIDVISRKIRDQLEMQFGYDVFEALVK